MKQRIYIDVNSSIGRMSFKEEGIPYKAESLLDEMKYYRVHASLVSSNVARDYSFIKGNEELIGQAEQSERLYTVATVIPHIKYELEEGSGYFDKLIQRGIKAFRIYPKSMNFGSSPFLLEKIAAFLMPKRIPLLIDSQETDWLNIKEILESYPDLNLLVYNTSWGTNRWLFPLMERFVNLYFDISSNQANDILKTCKNHFGIDRVLFGSNYPNKVIGGLKALVEYSGLPEEDKDKVSFKNAMTFFNLLEPPLYSDDEYMLDEISAKVDSGIPLDNVLVIDAHTHFVDSKHFTVSRFPIIHGNEEGLIKKMDLLGIDKMFISPWEGLMTDGSSANETSIKAYDKYRERIEVYAMCNPNYCEDLDSVVDIYHEKHRMIGLKPYYCFNQYDLLGEKYHKWFEYGNRNKLIMLVHTALPGIAEKVYELSRKYDNMSFLMAHSGESYNTAMDNIKVVKKRENVYLEITYTSLTNGIIEYMVEEVGADRVIFGTDMPMRDPAPQLAWICYAKISIKDKKKILGENILKLIKGCYT